MPQTIEEVDLSIINSTMPPGRSEPLPMPWPPGTRVRCRQACQHHRAVKEGSENNRQSRPWWPPSSPDEVGSFIEQPTTSVLPMF